MAAHASGDVLRIDDGATGGANFIAHIVGSEHEAGTPGAPKIIREWMALPQDKRRTEAQIEAFARKAMGRIAFRPDPYRQIVSWVKPRAGRQ